MESGLFSLSGKIALVTGGSRGIGFAVAKALAERGADVAIFARTKEQLKAAKRQIQADTNKKVWTFPFDIKNIEGVQSIFENIVSVTKDVDILVNCAGTTVAAYAGSKGGLLMLTKTLAAEWAKYNINVNAIGKGYIATDLTAPLQANEEFTKWVLSKNHKSNFLGEI